MSIRNCTRCGRLFTGLEDVCPTCSAREQEEFERVRSYLSRHHGATIAEVSGQTGVAVAQIYRWVRAGRLKVSTEQLGGALRCERCGEPIESGRFCRRCLGEVLGEIRRVVATAPPSRAQAGPVVDVTGSGDRQAKVHTREDVKRRFG